MQKNTTFVLYAGYTILFAVLRRRIILNIMMRFRLLRLLPYCMYSRPIFLKQTEVNLRVGATLFPDICMIEMVTYKCDWESKKRTVFEIFYYPPTMNSKLEAGTERDGSIALRLRLRNTDFF
jgi:hypothetical protein